MPTVQGFRDGFFGVRPNRFVINMNWPSAARGVAVQPDMADLFIYVKGADLPGSSVGAINIPWQGRVVKFSGERQYTDWVIQVYDSSIPAKDLRNGFESWMEALDGRNSHKIDYNLTTDMNVYYSDIIPASTTTPLPTQQQSNFNKSIKLKNCWPTDLSSITLNYDVSDSFAEYTVQIAYDYWEFTDDNNSSIGSSNATGQSVVPGGQEIQ